MKHRPISASELAILAALCLAGAGAASGIDAAVHGTGEDTGEAGDARPAAPAVERVRLKTGNVLEGKIVKRTKKAIFLDIGHTILTVPLEEVDEVIAPEVSGSASEASGGEEAEGSGNQRQAGQRDSIFYARKGLKPGPIEEKAREVAESVVKIQCLQKSGSGFVIDDQEGYIVTNYHVIEREREIAVLLYMQTRKGLRKIRKDNVRILAFNPYSDLALLKLEDREGVTLRKAYLGDYASVGLGDPVFAVGSPLGLERSVSQGIVSNRNRARQGLVYIQTTAAINPGNSGGALFNNRGEVIGVTNMKIFGGESLGFAIPVHHLKDFLRNFEAFAYDKDNPNTGIRYVRPPPKPSRESPGERLGKKEKKKQEKL